MAIQRTSSLVKNISDTIHENSKPLIGIAVFFVGLLVLFYAHKLWVVKRERAAQYDFSSLMTEYETLSREKNPEWDGLLDKFEKNYEKHASSSLLPYYLGYKVRILLHQGKKEDAIQSLDTIIAAMPGSSVLAVYEMERALVQLDSADKSTQSVGLEALKKLAHDTSNQFRDGAQYYLGSYYWAHNEIDAARQVWQQLVDEQHDEKMAPSPWAGLVRDKLALTII